MKLGDALIMIGSPASGYRNPKRLGQATQSLYINVKGVDKHSNARGKLAPSSSRSQPTRRTATGVMVRRIPKAMNGTLCRTLAVRNRNGKPLCGRRVDREPAGRMLRGLCANEAMIDYSSSRRDSVRSGRVDLVARTSVLRGDVHGPCKHG